MEGTTEECETFDGFSPEMRALINRMMVAQGFEEMGQATSKHEAFWEACGFGHWINVEKFIKEGVDVNWVSYTHNSCPIHVASQGKPEVVDLLIAANCNVNALDDQGNLALHHAAMKGHSEIITKLVKAGSEINKQNNNGWTALINAAYWCQSEAVKTLLGHGCDVYIKNMSERNALHEACRSKSPDSNDLSEVVRMLIDAGLDKDEKSTAEGYAQNDFTPLMFAAYHGHYSAARVLLELGCDAHQQGSNGWTALHWASNRGYRNIVQLLIDHGIDANTLGERDLTAFHVAKSDEIKNLLAPHVDCVEMDQLPSPYCHRRPSVTTDEDSRSESDLSDSEFYAEDREIGGGDISIRDDQVEIVPVTGPGGDGVVEVVSDGETPDSSEALLPDDNTYSDKDSMTPQDLSPIRSSTRSSMNSSLEAHDISLQNDVIPDIVVSDCTDKTTSDSCSANSSPCKQNGGSSADGSGSDDTSNNLVTANTSLSDSLTSDTTPSDSMTPDSNYSDVISSPDSSCHDDTNAKLFEVSALDGTTNEFSDLNVTEESFNVATESGADNVNGNVEPA